MSLLKADLGIVGVAAKCETYVPDSLDSTLLGSFDHVRVFDVADCSVASR